MIAAAMIFWVALALARAVVFVLIYSVLRTPFETIVVSLLIINTSSQLSVGLEEKVAKLEAIRSSHPELKITWPEMYETLDTLCYWFLVLFAAYKLAVAVIT